MTTIARFLRWLADRLDPRRADTNRGGGSGEE